MQQGTIADQTLYDRHAIGKEIDNTPAIPGEKRAPKNGSFA